MKAAVGIDIGGVIIESHERREDTTFCEDNFLNTPAVFGAIEAIRHVVEQRFGTCVYLISKCGPKVQHLTLQWLEARDFFSKAAVAPGNVRFCRERRQKAAICEQLGITHFVDDRLEVLSYLSTVEHLYLFQPRLAEVQEFAEFRNRVREVGAWDQLRHLLIAE